MENSEDALDGSAKEIAVHQENPISTDPSPSAKWSHGSTAHSAPFEGIAISVCGPPTDQSQPGETVAESEIPFTTDVPRRPLKPVTAENAADKIVKLPLDRLLRHPFNEKLYGATSPEEIGNLAASIAEVGQMSPVVVTADMEKVGFYAYQHIR